MTHVDCDRIFCEFNSFRSRSDDIIPHCLSKRISLTLKMGHVEGFCCENYRLVKVEEETGKP